jgi:enterochelin esterase-like enzyme
MPTGPTPTANPSITPNPTRLCGETQGVMERDTVPTDRQPWPVDLRVFLPPCYDSEREPGYPLLIILHGQIYTFDQWDRDGLDEAAYRLTAAGAVEPMILVMPNESQTERPPNEANFDEVVAGAVLPWIEARYNICADRFCRAVGGLSRGAGWAVRIGFRRPELFGSVGAHSYPPSGRDLFALSEWVEAVPTEDLPRFYLDMGDRDWPEFVAANRDFRTEMTRLGIPFEWHWNAGGHDDAYWSAHVEEYLLWYAQAWAGLTR